MNNEFFKNPKGNADYSISPFWFWNDLITDEKVNEQLNMMARINAGQPVVHARSGLLNAYLSEDWFSKIKNTIEQAKKNQQKIWLYDENNWPSGNCSWTITQKEENREHFLVIEKKELKAGEFFNLDCADKIYLNISAYSSEAVIDLLVIAQNKKINFEAREATEVYTVELTVNSYEPFGKYSVDYLSKKQLRTFIDSTHEKYADHFQEEFGKTIRGIFMDETRFFNALPWTETLQEEFLSRKGYDLVPLLPFLLKEGKESRFIRYDYYDVISDMMREATFKQIYDWSEQHGILTTGHFLGEETLATQSRFNGDMMRMYRDFHIPGIDHLGNGIGSLDAKMCSSAAHNYGKGVVSCESFGAAGWDITFEEMIKISNWLFQQGVNMILIHGFYYSIRDERKNDWPPSYFHQWKYWDMMPLYADMAARMSYMLQDGRTESDILVYYPIETFWNYFAPNFVIQTCYFKEGPFVENEQAKFMDNQFQLLCSTLMNKNLDFDIMNSDAAENFEVKNGRLVNRLTGAEFSVFVLPLVETIPETMVKLLNGFMEQGGKVISYKSNPVYIVGKNGEHSRETEATQLEQFRTDSVTQARKIMDVVEICKQEIDCPFEITCGIDEVSRTQMSYPDRIHDPYLHDGEQQYGVGVTRYLKEGKRILNLTNYNDKDEPLTIYVKSKEAPELYIPETGDMVKVTEYQATNEGYEFSFLLPKNRTYFVVCGL